MPETVTQVRTIKNYDTGEVYISKTDLLKLLVKAKELETPEAKNFISRLIDGIILVH